MNSGHYLRMLTSIRHSGSSRKRGVYMSGSNLREPFYKVPSSNAPKILSDDLSEAFSVLKDNSNVFCQGAAATPTYLMETLKKYVISKNLKNINIYHIHTDGPYPFIGAECDGHFFSNSLFTGKHCRDGIKQGRASYVPIFLSEIPRLFRRGHIKLDLSLISVSDEIDHGYMSLGPSVDTTRAAVQNSKVVLGQMNKEVPFTFGDANIHKTQVDFITRHDAPMHKSKESNPSDVELKIGKLIADNLIEDGATLQMGIGSIPDAVLAQLGNHKDLGIHTEMFSDGLVKLMGTGAVTNAKKGMHPGKIVSSFVVGSQKVFDFLHHNALIQMCDIEYVNAPRVISKNPKMSAINSCIEVDITGQVCSDSIGARIYSGFGGQLDFIYGSSAGRDGLGKPIMAFASQTAKGKSKITPYLAEGAGVVTTRAHIRYVVTEYGIAFLFGKNLLQRAYELINIAHPDNREELEKAAFKRLGAMPRK